MFKPKLMFICRSWQKSGVTRYERTFRPFSSRLAFNNFVYRLLPYSVWNFGFTIIKTDWFYRLEIFRYAIHLRRLSWNHKFLFGE